MGEVFKPEDILKKKRYIPDLASRPIPQPPNLETIVEDIETIKKEIVKIKSVLKSHGITYE